MSSRETLLSVDHHGTVTPEKIFGVVNGERPRPNPKPNQVEDCEGTGLERLHSQQWHTIRQLI